MTHSQALYLHACFIFACTGDVRSKPVIKTEIGTHTISNKKDQISLLKCGAIGK